METEAQRVRDGETGEGGAKEKQGQRGAGGWGGGMVSDKATGKENYANAEKGGSGRGGGSHSESKETKGLWRESRSSFGPRAGRPRGGDGELPVHNK